MMLHLIFIITPCIFYTYIVLFLFQKYFSIFSFFQILHDGYYVDAPVDWCCEECDIGKGIMFSSSGLENVHYEGPMLPASEKICQSTVQPKKHS
uniref:Putative ovule protein n=1 Tax=Solanum chacoense TaxID=4108 RepID=A0A0V0GSQ6_SOLCH